MKVSKKIYVLFFALLVLLAAGLPAFAADGASAADDLKGKTLQLAINATFPPFESAKPDGTFQGLDIDIANRLAEKLGFTFEISDMAFEGLVGALNSGRADFVISGISPTTERLKVLDTSASYFFATVSIVCRTEDNYTTPESLKGHKVGTIFGTAYEGRAQSWPDVEVVGINGSVEVVQELLNSRIDAAVLDGCHAAEYIKMNPGKMKLTLLPIELDIEDSFSILFPKGSPYREPMDAALKEMLKSGEVDALIEKWLGTEYLTNYRDGLEKAGFSY